MAAVAVEGGLQPQQPHEAGGLLPEGGHTAVPEREL